MNNGGTFAVREVGKCLTEYRHINWDRLVGEFKRFIVVSQFDEKEALTLPAGVKGKWTDQPRCGYGEVLFGVTDQGELFRLMAIYDSSD